MSNSATWRRLVVCLVPCGIGATQSHTLPLIAKCKLQSAKKGFLFFAQRSARGVLDAINWGAKVRFRPLKVHKSMSLPTQNVPFSALFWMPFRGQKNRG